MSSTDQPITCLIADDHEIVREGLRMALSREPNIRVVGEASDGEAAVVLAERRRPAVVLMDVRMGNVDGVTAASRIRDRVPGTAVVLFTAHAERNLLQRGREAGARGYVLKEAGHDTIVRAIDRVARGEDFIDPALAPSLLELSRESLITGREREILQLLADGESTTFAARELGLSEETVKTHTKNALARLGARNRTHAVAIGIREHLLD